MNIKKELPEKLVYTQTWSDVKYIIVILAIIMGIFVFTSKTNDSKMAFIGAFLYITFLLIFIFIFIAIRKFEIYPDKIIILFPRNREVVIFKTDIEQIIVKYQPEIFLNRVRPAKMLFTFKLKKFFRIFFYCKKFTINSFLFGDTAFGEKTLLFIEYLRKHYSDILIEKLPVNNES